MKILPVGTYLIHTINYTMNIKVNEIFFSIQGESTFVGKPCIFIRLTGCNLRCVWCDSEYAFYDGKEMTINEILKKIQQYNCNLVEVTGGEPLMQENCITLINLLLQNGYEVMLETGGSLSVSNVPDPVIKIIDFKCPGSKMEKNNLWSILDELTPKDEIKFVIADREDFEWAIEKVTEFQLTDKRPVLFSPVYGEMEYEKLSKWILKSNLPIRFQIQLHKHIWDPETTGV